MLAGLGLTGALVAALAGPSCQTVPVTGRTSGNIFTIGYDESLGASAFDEITAGQPILTSGQASNRVSRVFDRLVAVADDPGFEWEAVLIDDDATVNAFALPGGKCAVYSGILPVCEDDSGLAVVLGHEIGHVVARHGTERLTREVGIEAGLALLQAGEYEALTRTLVALTLSLPYSRSQELEADHIGLVYMARAGYDPRAAPAFWRRMDSSSADRPIEFLSTHPSPESRIRRLQELLPQALAVWQRESAPEANQNVKP